MKPSEFRALLGYMGWSQTTAAEELAVAGQSRVSVWARGDRPIPSYIASSVRAHAQLHHARKVLEAVEYAADGACPVCSATDGNGHFPDCALTLAITGTARIPPTPDDPDQE